MQHIRLKHKFMLNSTITCKFDNCDDQFTNVYSLRRHVLNKHISETKLASNITSKQISDIVFDTDASEFSDATSTISNFNSNNSNEGQEKIYKTIEMNDSVNDEKFDIDIYQSTVFKSALCTVVKLYAGLTLSRETILKIIKTVSETYLATSIQALQQCCKNNNNLNISLNIIKNGFAFLKSERKTFKYLEQINCPFCLKI